MHLPPFAQAMLHGGWEGLSHSAGANKELVRPAGMARMHQRGAAGSGQDARCSVGSHGHQVRPAWPGQGQPGCGATRVAPASSSSGSDSRSSGIII
eukprot:SAG31_NODE_25846_length_453_cov_0.508475_1_plen_95_part_01